MLVHRKPQAAAPRSIHLLKGYEADVQGTPLSPPCQPAADRRLALSFFGPAALAGRVERRAVLDEHKKASFRRRLPSLRSSGSPSARWFEVRRLRTAVMAGRIELSISGRNRGKSTPANHTSAETRAGLGWPPQRDTLHQGCWAELGREEDGRSRPRCWLLSTRTRTSVSHARLSSRKVLDANH